LPALATVHVSLIHVVGVIGLLFNPTCLALGLMKTTRKNQ
jgi:hypothetical protein